MSQVTSRSGRLRARLLSFVGLLGLPAFVGAAVGLGDAAIAIAEGTPFSVALLVLSTSLGAGVAAIASFPVVAAIAIVDFPRSDGGRIGAIAGGFALAPGLLVLGKLLYKRIPWGAADVLIAVAALAGAVVVIGFAARLGSLWNPGRSAAFRNRLLAWGLPALLLTVPIGVRALAAIAGRPFGMGDGGGSAGSPRVGERGLANLLLVTVDTLRDDRLGCLGDPVARTPWLDRLARSSVSYTDCLAPSPWTLPSLASVVTGTYPGEHLVLRELSGLSASVRTIAELCAEDGRRTAAFVSNPWLATGNLARGFGTFDVAERVELLGPARATRLGRTITKVALRGLRLDSARTITDRGLAWLERGEGAWLLWLHYFDPHLPNWPPPPYDRLFGPPPAHVGSSLGVEDIRAGRFEGGEEGREEIERLYRGEVAFTDHAIGRVWRALERRGELEVTAIVFSADHGEEFWEHAGYGHGHTMFDEVVRVPLIVREASGRPRAPAGPADPPTRTAGSIVPDLVRLVDLAPTALAAARVVPLEPTRFTGRSLLGALPPPVAYGEATLYGDEQKYLRSGRWKLVFRLEAEPAEGDAGDASGAKTAGLGAEVVSRISLFDLETDPAERHDLAGREPALRDSLFAALAGWIAEVGSAGAMAARDAPENLDPSMREMLKSLGYIE